MYVATEIITYIYFLSLPDPSQAAFPSTKIVASQTCSKLQYTFGTQSCEAVGTACLQKAISVFTNNSKSFYLRLKDGKS
jgi:hypothetical protein